MANPLQYDVTLSFAGEDRPYVEATAEALRNKGIEVFYDEWEKVNLWGKNLYDHLVKIYRDSARYCVIFISKHYARKVWPNHERQSAQERALKEHQEYVLPARFDNTKIPGLLDTVFYLDLHKIAPNELADMIETKLGPRVRRNFLPPNPDRLFKLLGLTTAGERKRALSMAGIFFDSWIHLKPNERQMVLETVTEGCRAELPKHLHIGLDHLQRYTGLSSRQIKHIIPLIRDLGFVFDIRLKPKRGFRPVADVTFEYVTLRTAFPGFQTLFADAMLKTVLAQYCAEHGREMLLNADFGQLSSANKPESAHTPSNRSRE